MNSVAKSVPVRDAEYRESANGHVCDVPGCGQTESVVLAHIRWGGRGGTGFKPSDSAALFLCHAHHEAQENGGAEWLADLLVAWCEARYHGWRRKKDIE